MNTQMQHTTLLDPAWDPKSAADQVLKGLVRVTGPEVLGAHDAEFVCIGDHAFIVTTANDERPGEHPSWPFCYVTLSVVHLPTLTVEKRIPMAHNVITFDGSISTDCLRLEMPSRQSNAPAAVFEVRIATS